MEDRPQRKRPAHFLPKEAHERAVIIFLTVCTDRRRPLLAHPAIQDHLRASWAAATHWMVGRYVLMPDHVHLFCAPGCWPPTSLDAWIRFWKSRSAVTWPTPEAGPVWQRGWWDTQLRAHQSYAAKWDYVRHNPVRAGLTPTSEAWPFQGEMNELPWHD